MLNVIRDVFKDYKEPNNILDCKIKNINLFKKSHKLEIDLISEKKITLLEIDKFEEFLKTKFQVSTVILNLEYDNKNEETEHKFSNVLESWEKIISYLAKKYPLTKAILHDSTVKEDGNKLIVVLRTKNADFMYSYELDKIIARLIYNLYGLKYKVEYEEDVSEDIIKKQEKYFLESTCN